MDKRTIYAEFDNHGLQAGLLTVVVSFALSQGMKPGEIQDSIGCEIEDIVDAESRLDEKSMPRLWKAIAERQPGRPLTLELAGVAPFSSTAGLYYGFQYARDVREAIEFVVANRSILVDRLKMELDVHNGEAAMVSSHDCDDIDSGLSIEMGNAIFWRILKETTSEKISLVRAEFRHQPNFPEDHYRSYFGANVIFEQPRNALVFETKWLAEPLRNANRGFFEFAQRYFSRVASGIEKRKIPDELKNLQKAIVENAITGDFSSRSAALKARMSLRSAQRLSEANGSSLKGLIETIRTSGAKKLLTEQDLNIEAIAELLGYSDDRAFRRAFKRWTGETPSDYRRSRPET
ncbi:MAG: AraC family transcriptional regulator ligand-binding domain-containing protein [Pseudomonadota bacterium]